MRLDSPLLRYGFGDRWLASAASRPARLAALIDQQQTASRISGGGR